MTGRSSCPECGTILRIRDKSFIGRRVNCPECQATLQIEATDHKGQYTTKRVSNAGLARAGQIQAAGPSAQENPVKPVSSLRSSIVRIVYSPFTAAWLLAIAASVLIGVLTLSPKFRFAAVRPATNRTELKAPDILEPKVESPPVMTREITVVPEVEKALPQISDLDVVVSALEPANVDGTLKSLPMQKPPAATAPSEAPKAPPKVNVAAKMAQKISKYSQPKVRRRDLLDVLQEQLGAPIRYELQDLGEEKLDETVSFDLADTTIGEVIQTVANSAHWDVVIEETGIRLETRQGRTIQ